MQRGVATLQQAGQPIWVQAGPGGGYVLAAANGHWYLLGFCRLRQAPRWFRIDRVLAARLTGETGPRHDPATLFDVPAAGTVSAVTHLGR